MRESATWCRRRVAARTADGATLTTDSRTSALVFLVWGIERTAYEQRDGEAGVRHSYRNDRGI